ncbi:MAG: hypothetical protein CLLPBCKN_006211 [Chroococcidiopsis cubana SAG 39.79]|nr:hypothetical protein [Chroococcidiopsis cubana SAG 39.79]
MPAPQVGQIGYRFALTCLERWERKCHAACVATELKDFSMTPMFAVNYLQ